MRAADAADGSTKGVSFEPIRVTKNITCPLKEELQGSGGGATTVAYTPDKLNQYDFINPGTPVAPVHDLDGNLKEDAGINAMGYGLKFEWDAENRLTAIRKADNTLLVTYVYDPFGRRIRRTTTAAASQGASDMAYLYEGWNVVAEYSISSGPSVSLVQALTWGLDLSGSWQGAGGVGGLLCLHRGPGTDGSGNRTWTDAFYPTYDGNGNVSEYLDKNGAEVAHFEYDAFGKEVSSSGAVADFSYRFSTKPQDEESGLYYYGYRYYDPVTGRWPSRDRIEERGGVNLYGFVRNNGVGKIDRLGLEPRSAGFWGMGFDWLTGEHLPQTDYGPGSPQVEDMRRSDAIRELRDYFVEKNQDKCPNWEGVGNPDYGWGFNPFHLNGNFWQDMGNGTIHFVGSMSANITVSTELLYSGRVSRYGGQHSLICDTYLITATFHVYNTTSIDSLLRFLPGDQSSWNIIDETTELIPGDPLPMEERSQWVTPMANWRQTFTWDELFFCTLCGLAYDGCTDSRIRPEENDPYSMDDFFN